MRRRGIFQKISDRIVASFFVFFLDCSRFSPCAFSDRLYPYPYTYSIGKAMATRPEQVFDKFVSGVLIRPYSRTRRQCSYEYTLHIDNASRTVRTLLVLPVAACCCLLLPVAGCCFCCCWLDACCWQLTHSSMVPWAAGTSCHDFGSGRMTPWARK
jgi:hypothetical protein